MRWSAQSDLWIETEQIKADLDAAADYALKISRSMELLQSVDFVGAGSDLRVRD